jgi:hypothetical protein
LAVLLAGRHSTLETAAGLLEYVRWEMACLRETEAELLRSPADGRPSQAKPSQGD